MGIEQYAPWMSLLAAVLSIVYVAVDYWRPAPASAGREPTDRRSVGGFLDAYEGFFVVVGSTLVLAVAAHLGLRGTAFFYPSVIWTAFALVVVVVGLGELAADGATD